MNKRKKLATSIVAMALATTSANLTTQVVWAQDQSLTTVATDEPTTFNPASVTTTRVAEATTTTVTTATTTISPTNEVGETTTTSKARSSTTTTSVTTAAGKTTTTSKARSSTTTTSETTAVRKTTTTSKTKSSITTTSETTTVLKKKTTTSTRAGETTTTTVTTAVTTEKLEPMVGDKIWINEKVMDFWDVDRSMNAVTESSIKFDIYLISRYDENRWRIHVPFMNEPERVLLIPVDYDIEVVERLSHGCGVGDLNYDGQIDSFDMVLLRQAMFRDYDLDNYDDIDALMERSWDRQVADVNSDKKITVADLVSLQNFLLGRTQTFGETEE